MHSPYFLEITMPDDRHGVTDIIPVPDIERATYTPASDCNKYEEHLVIWMKRQPAHMLSTTPPKYEYWGPQAAVALAALRALHLPGAPPGTPPWAATVPALQDPQLAAEYDEVMRQRRQRSLGTEEPGPPTVFQLIGEYAHALGCYGPHDPRVRILRASNLDNREFQECVAELDRIQQQLNAPDPMPAAYATPKRIGEPQPDLAPGPCPGTPHGQHEWSDPARNTIVSCKACGKISDSWVVP